MRQFPGPGSGFMRPFQGPDLGDTLMDSVRRFQGPDWGDRLMDLMGISQGQINVIGLWVL